MSEGAKNNTELIFQYRHGWSRCHTVHEDMKCLVVKCSDGVTAAMLTIIALKILQHALQSTPLLSVVP